MNLDPTRTVPRSDLTSARAPDELGSLGRFRVLGELGRGGMGAVYRARDTRLDRDVALKVLLPGLATDARARARFLREARAQARVEHEHIIPIYEAEEVGGVAYIAMPLLRGQTLKDAFRPGTRPPVPELARLGREIADGLTAAHAVGLIHRDIKPGNIWLEGEKRRVKILDFGLARTAADAPDAVPASSAALVSTEVSLAGAITGTPAYMSPEQARSLPVDHRSDVFSLGVVLYELATGHKPFAGPTPFDLLAAIVSTDPVPLAELAPHVPPALAELISRMLAKDPAARPQTCAEVSAVLAALAVPSVVVLPLGGGPPNVWEDLTTAEGDTATGATRTDAPARPEPLAPLAPRPKWLWPAVAGAVVLAAAVGVALALRGTPAEHAKADPAPPAPKSAPKREPSAGPPVKPPEGDEVVLFDGTDLSKWRSAKTNGQADWLVENGCAVATPGRGNIYSVEKFRDHTIHLEYCLPNDKDGNSGVYVHGCFEVSIFDDAGKSATFISSGGIYGRHAPLKNASKPAGEWQTLDITVAAGRDKQVPRITVVHNGELVLNGAEPTANTPQGLPQLVVDGAGPVMLQEHGSRVRFRNVRVRRPPAPRRARSGGPGKNGIGPKEK